jgi:cell division protein FtsX
MDDYCINVFLDDEQEKKIRELGLGDQIQEIEGKKAVQVSMSQKDQKKLKKGFPDIEFDSLNTCVLPDEAQLTLIDIIFQTKSLEVMKFAITKLYNPLAGKALRSKVH